MRTRALLYTGAVGPALFVVAFLVEGALRPGYSSWRNYVSELSLGESGFVQIANFLVDGALTFILAIGLRRALSPGRGVRLGTTLIAINAAALVVAGAFVTDPGLGYPPGAAGSGLRSTAGTIHAVAGLAAFTTLGASGFALSRRFEGGWRAYGVASGALVLLLFVASTAAGTLDDAGVLQNAPVGLLQRASIVSGNAWLVAVALRAAREEAAA